jgi:hypothetical protein
MSIREIIQLSWTTDPKLRESLKPYLGGARQFQAIAFSEFVTITIILTP